jgi:hypothetical protein
MISHDIPLFPHDCWLYNPIFVGLLPNKLNPHGLNWLNHAKSKTKSPKIPAWLQSFTCNRLEQLPKLEIHKLMGQHVTMFKALVIPETRSSMGEPTQTHVVINNLRIHTYVSHDFHITYKTIVSIINLIINQLSCLRRALLQPKPRHLGSFKACTRKEFQFLHP